MKRRSFVLGGLGAGGLLAAAWLRPADRGQPHTEYFQALNRELQDHGPMRPTLLVDLDRLDQNIDVVRQFLARSGKQLRLVEKSLPAPQLLRYIGERLDTQRLMSFHQPFLNQDARLFPRADILVGKPLPVRSAQLFYQQHQGEFDPAQQLQWLIDTPERLQQYAALAQGLGARLRINIELDVGLHRGGVSDMQTLRALLQLIADNPQHLLFSGFMGYDPFVGMNLPSVLGSQDQLLAKAMALYQSYVDFTRQQFPALWRDDLTLNTAGSPSYRAHEQETLSNEVALGSGLLKPSHFDLPSLAEHVPALYIATPVLKRTGPLRLPVLDETSRWIAGWDVNRRETFFIYGGNWQADPVSPAGLQLSGLFGRSSNQELLNGSPKVGLQVDDLVFLRPTQSEAVLLQFGDLLAVRDGRIVERWPVYQES